MSTTNLAPDIKEPEVQGATSPTSDSLASTVDGPSVFGSSFDHHVVNFPRMLRSEWLKLWSLRSTWWVSGMTIVLMAGLALLFAAIMNTMINDPEVMAGANGAAADPSAANGGMGNIDMAAIAVLIIVIGYQFAQLTVAVFGVLAISNEYTSGMIRATFSAAPRRLRTLWAKLIVVTVTTVAIAVVGLALSWLVSHPLLSRNDMAVDFGNATHVRAIVGTILYLVAIAWLSLGVGTILRHTAAGISTVMALIMVLPMILSIIVATAPTVQWVSDINKFLPSVAGERIIMGGIADTVMMGPGMESSANMLGPWPGFLVLLGYAVLALVIAAVRIKKTDA
ncbi:MAG: ABC transporter permease [Cellulomonadaceae bacterium]|jgi:ABC-2 type transport system permease protein|nr:ABC transporter permease [Cellulomonadaceae bacterium]